MQVLGEERLTCFLSRCSHGWRASEQLAGILGLGVHMVSMSTSIQMRIQLTFTCCFGCFCVDVRTGKVCLSVSEVAISPS